MVQVATPTAPQSPHKATAGLSSQPLGQRLRACCTLTSTQSLPCPVLVLVFPKREAPLPAGWGAGRHDSTAHPSRKSVAVRIPAHTPFPGSTGKKKCTPKASLPGVWAFRCLDAPGNDLLNSYPVWVGRGWSCEAPGHFPVCSDRSPMKNISSTTWPHSEGSGCRSGPATEWKIAQHLVGNRGKEFQTGGNVSKCQPLVRKKGFLFQNV